MSVLHTLPKLVYKKARRLGRGTGSRWGEKSTRGTKRHQAAKERIPIFFEGGQNPMTKKFPLLRGKMRNKSVKIKPMIVSIDMLKGYKKGEEITVKSLIAKNLIDKKAMMYGVKLLGNGKITQALHVKIPVSKSAQLKIEEAGGSVS